MTPAPGQAAGTGYQPPRDPAEIWLARQWQHVLGFTVGIGDNFFAVGGNSLDAARIIDAALADLGIQLPLNTLTAHPTIEHLATVLRHATPPPPALAGPLITLQDGDGTGPPLFLIHPDHGHISPYCRLACALGEQYAVCALQPAGLYTGTAPRRTIPAMAAAYLDTIQAAHPAGPYQLGGCAIGAAIACEIAARLDDVRLLAAIDTNLLQPPHAVTGPWPHDPPQQPDLPQILASWQEHDLIPHDTAPEFAARTLRVWQANQAAARHWQPPPYTGPVDVFGQPPAPALPATAIQRTHQCSTSQHLTDALRALLG